MTRYLLAGGGSAGHVNPLLSLAARLRAEQPENEVLVLGTEQGLENELVPAAGFELLKIPRLPLPRRPSVQALRFPARFRSLVRDVEAIIRSREITMLVGFGGYVSAPAYLAARRARIPVVVHEGNGKPGLANRLGARGAARVGVTFPGTPLPRARVVGMPLRASIENLDRQAARVEGLRRFGLSPERPVLLVTSGSLGAKKVNETVVRLAEEICGRGWQVLQLLGSRTEGAGHATTHALPPDYHQLPYLGEMELALAVADLAVARAGAATVCEFLAVGVPAIYVPLPLRGGDQKFNLTAVAAAGGAVQLPDAELTAERLRAVLLPLLNDEPRRRRMAEIAASQGIHNGTERLAWLVAEALAEGATRGGRP